MFAATRQPTMRRENASTMKHTYAIPDPVGTYVRSVTHNASGRSAVKSRFKTASRTARAEAGRDFAEWYVLGAISNVRQMGSTPNSSRCAST